MPYKSEAQRRYFNSLAGKKKIGEEEVEHWNEVSKGKKLPEKAVDKAIRLCDTKQHIGSYKGWNVSWDTSTGYYLVSNKNEKFTAVSEKGAIEEIERRESKRKQNPKPITKLFVFKVFSEHNGYPYYKDVKVQAYNEQQARKLVKKQLRKGEQLL